MDNGSSVMSSNGALKAASAAAAAEERGGGSTRLSSADLLLSQIDTRLRTLATLIDRLHEVVIHVNMKRVSCVIRRTYRNSIGDW